MESPRSIFVVVAEWWEQRQAYRHTIAPKRKAGPLNYLQPTLGSMIFTLVMILLLVVAQTAGAIPLGAYRAATEVPSTGTIAYQGRLADASGNPLTSTVNMEFRLYSAASGGTPVWSELWTGSNAVQVSDGLFNVMLGSLTPIPQAIVTGGNSLWLGITAGTDDEMTPRVQLGSVPFAVQALTVPDGSVTSVKMAEGAASGLWYAKGMSRVTTRSSDWTPLADMRLEVTSIGRPVLVSFDTGFSIVGDPNAGYVGFGIFVDGQAKTLHAQRVDRAGESTSMQLTHIENLAPGEHVVEIKWRVSPDTITAQIDNANPWEQRVVVVEEIRR